MPRHFAKPPAHVLLAALFVMTLCSGNAVGAASPSAPQVQSDPAQSSAPYAGFIAEAARRFGLPEAWIRAVMRAESGGNPRAVSSSGAMGLMQLMPQTWRELRVALSLGDDPFDPQDNIMAGAAYLRAMHDRYGMPGALAAYNAGPGRWEAFQAGTQPLPDETVAYVAALAPLIDVHAVASESPGLLRPGPDAEDIFAASVFARAGTEGSAPAKHAAAQHDGRLSVGHVPAAAQPQGMFVAISTQPGSTANHAPVTTSVPFSAHSEGLFPRSGAAGPRRLAP